MSNTRAQTTAPLWHSHGRLLGILGLAWLASVACAQPATPLAVGESAAGADASLTVMTERGPVRGTRGDGTDGQADLRIFRGIPYARPPVGSLRWRPPEAHPPWTQVRAATDFSAACWQPQSRGGFYGAGEIKRSEDCLYLNVWSRATGAAPQPVMVWIHGGALVQGSGDRATYNGARLTQEGVVVVTLNYRLGVMGFLAHADLSAESPDSVSGNYGIRDQIAALQWIQDNIAQFGGDPTNVTIFGESAGSWSVCYLVATPAARGLFHKAIGQSGGCHGPHPNLKSAGVSPSGHSVGAGLTSTLGASVRALRDLTAEELDDRISAANWRRRGRMVYVDGDLFPQQMHAQFSSNQHNAVPAILGSNADEGTTLFRGFTELPIAAYEARVRRSWGSRGDAMLAAYGADAARSTKIALQQMASDRLFAWEMRTWARAQTRSNLPAYLYYFSHAPELPLRGTSLGAFHAAEIAYVFGNIYRNGEPRPSDVAVANSMVQYWTNFAKSGNPNGAGLVEWPRFDLEQDQALEITATPRVIAELRKAKLDIMDAHFLDQNQTH